MAAHPNSLVFPSGDVIEVYYGDNRFGTMTDSGTATLKPRPRVRPLLTFLPLVSIQAGAGIHCGTAQNHLGWLLLSSSTRGKKVNEKQNHSIIMLDTRD